MSTSESSELIPSNTFFTADETILGKTYNYWVKRWCQWFYGKKLEQEELESQVVENVLFIGSKLTVENEHATFRSVDSLPTANNNNNNNDKPILVNCAKWTSFGIPFVHKKEDLVKLSKEREDTLELLKVTVNGQEIKPTRCSSGSDVFKIKVEREIAEHNDPILGHIPKVRKGKYDCCIDGFWLFFKPNTITLLQDVEINSLTSCKTGVLSLNLNHKIRK